MANGGTKWLCLALCDREPQHLSIPQVSIGLRSPGGLWGKTPSGGSGGRSVCGYNKAPVCHSVLLCPPFAGGGRPGKGVPRFRGGPGVCFHFHPPAHIGDGATQPTALARAVSKESHPGSISNPGGRRKPGPTSGHPTHSGYLPGK